MPPLLRGAVSGPIEYLIPSDTLAARLAGNAMRLIVAILALFLAGAPATAQAVKYQRVSDRVFLVPDRAQAGMRFEMVVNAGAFDEAEGKVTGIAHYLEHLVLVGRNAEHGDAAVRMFADGSTNGWTNDRATVYLHNVPARAEGYTAELEKLFGFYAARLKDFAITDADAARERNVVLQEHDLRTQSSPTALFYREANRRFIPDHPAGGWVVGTRESIAAMTLEEARAYHRAWYAPNNVWFVIRGDIPPERLKEIADKALAGIAEKPLPARLKDAHPALGPAPEAYRMRHPDVTRTLVVVGRMVRVAETDYLRQQATMTLLSAYLGSRFEGSGFDRLNETQRVAADDLSFYLRRVAPSTLVLSLASSVAAGRTAAELQAAMAAYIDRIGSDGVPSEEQFRRLRQRMLDQIARAHQPVQVHGRLVSWLADGRTPERFDQWAGIVGSITRQDVAALAAALAAPGKEMVATLEPDEAAQ
jgi:zinc protease